MSPPTTYAQRSAAPPTGLLGRARSWMSRLIDPFRHLLQELKKFGIVGGIAYVIDLSVYNLLWSPQAWLWAAAVSTTVAATAAFIGNRFWTWRHRERSGLAREYGLYFFFNAVGLGIGLSVLWLSHNALGAIWPAVFQTQLADNIAKMVFGMALGTAFRFWSYRRFVFVAPPLATSHSDA